MRGCETVSNVSAGEMAEIQQIREVPAKLAFFQPEIVQDTIENGYTEEHYPIGFQSDSYTDPIRFFIRGSEHWIDFEKSYIDISGTITGTDGDANTPLVAANAEITLTNNFFHSLFSSIHVNVNESAVTFSNDNYPYLAYIQNVFNYPHDFETHTGELYCWAKDTAEYMNQYKSTDNNVGAKTRKNWIKTEQKVRGVMKLRSPLLLARPYLLSFLNVDITLNRVTTPAFYISAKNGNSFKFKIDSMIFKVRKVKLIASFVEGIENMLHQQNERIIYPLRDARVFTKTYAGFGTEIIEDNLFHGVLPDRIIVGLVDNDAFNGSTEKNPFNFQHKNMTEIGFLVNGTAHPLSMIPVNFDTGDYHTAYYHMLDSVQAANPTGNTINISKKDFGAGYTLFSFDMSADQYGSLNHQTLYNQPANVTLKMKFKTGMVADVITLVVYYETASRMVVDGSRQVQIFSK